MTPFEYYKLRNVKSFHAHNIVAYKQILGLNLHYFVVYQSKTDKHLVVRELINRASRFKDQLEQINHTLDDSFLSAKSVYDNFGQSFKDFEAECRNTLSLLD